MIENRIETVWSRTGDLNKRVAEFNEEGWEVTNVSTDVRSNGTMWTVIFKREKP